MSPKLNQKTAKAVDSASDGFEPLPDGVYHARLVEVDGSREGPSGPYWSWEFEVVEEGEYQKRKIWNNTSLADTARFGLKQTFKAFGKPTDTDTDELIGKVIRLVVGTRTIQEGARKGEPANQVNRLLPPDDDFELPESVGAAAGGQPSEEDIFS